MLKRIKCIKFIFLIINNNDNLKSDLCYLLKISFELTYIET